MALETLIVPNDQTPVDLLLWRRFRREVPGLVEQTLAHNPGLADLGPFPPAGTTVVVTAPSPQDAAAKPVISLFD